MKSSLDKLNLVSHLSEKEIYALARILWRKQRKGLVAPSEILDNQVKQGVIKHLNEKYGQSW